MNRRKKYLESDRALEQAAQTEWGVSCGDTETCLGAFWNFWREPALGGREEWTRWSLRIPSNPYDSVTTFPVIFLSRTQRFWWERQCEDNLWILQRWISICLRMQFEMLSSLIWTYCITWENQRAVLSPNVYLWLRCVFFFSGWQTAFVLKLELWYVDFSNL